MEENLPTNNQNTNPAPHVQTSTEPQPVEETQPKRKPSAVKIAMFIIILLLLVALGYMIYQNNQLKNQLSYKTMPTPAPTPELTPMPDITADWNSYINTANNYSIKYPPNFLTQPVAAGAGTIEALPISRQIFIYNPKDEEPYLNRYIEIQQLNLETPMSEKYTKTNTTVGNKNAIKYTSADPELLFDIYIVNLDKDQGILEIYVSNSEDKKETANQILFTLKFTDSELVCPDTKVIDCSPCTGGPCPLMFPMYCSKGSAQYNWIFENCPDVTFIGLE